MRALSTNVGTKITTSTPEEWAEEANLNWNIEEHQVVVNNSVVDGRKALINSSTGELLNIVSTKYKPVQPQAMLKTFHCAVDNAGFKMDRMGSYGGGKVIWGRADIHKPFELNGNDLINHYMYFVTSADGTSATHAFLSSMRCTCMNALNLAEKAAAISFKTYHRQDYFPQSFMLKVGAIDNIILDFNSKINALSHKPVELAGGFNDIYKELYPLENKDIDSRAYKLWNTKRERIWDAMQFSDGSDIGESGTLWKMLNGFTYDIDHNNKSRSEEASHKHVIMGGGAKEKVRIMNKLLEYV